MEKDPKLNIFTNYNQKIVAVIMIYADSEADLSKIFEPFEKLSSHVSTAVPETERTVFTIVQTLSAMGHIPQSLK